MIDAAERELKLRAPTGFRLPSFDDLPDGVSASARAPKRLLATYVDTDDLRLLRWGVTIRHRTGDGWTVKLPDSLDGDFLVRRELTFPGLPRRVPDEVLDLVRAYARTEPLSPQARLRTVRRVVDLRAGDGGVVGEIADDEVSILDGRRIAGRFRELEIEASEAMGEGLAEGLVAWLQRAGAGEPSVTPKVVRALGEAAEAPPEVVAEKLGADASAGDVVRRALATSVIRLLRHDVVVRLDSHLEGVHKTRVATRTMRSDLRTFAELVDPQWSAALRGELGWLAGLLGRVRDTDVMLARLRDGTEALPAATAGAAAPILATLERERASARAELLEAMRSDRYVALLDRLVSAAREPVLAEPAARPAAEIVPRLVRRPWRALRQSVAALSSPPTDEELHRVRIRAKRCRYAAEAAAAVSGKRAALFARAATALQDVLGELNDAAVAEAWLLAWATPRRSPKAVFAAGELAGLERAAALAARRRWRSQWKGLVATRPRGLP
jgi:CHAD domain-containing protein